MKKLLLVIVFLIPLCVLSQPEGKTCRSSSFFVKIPHHVYHVSQGLTVYYCDTYKIDKHNCITLFDVQVKREFILCGNYTISKCVGK